MSKKEVTPTVRGSQLKITERDIYTSLPKLSQKISAFLFGGTFYMPDPTPNADDAQPMFSRPRAAVTYVPPLFIRLYYKHIQKRIGRLQKIYKLLYTKRTFNPYKRVR